MAKSQVNVYGLDERTFLFGYRDAVDGLKCESEVEKPLRPKPTAHCERMQTVATLCRFQCSVSDVCAISSAVALDACL